MKVRKNIILVVACTAVFFEALDIAIINLAVPSIQKSFLLSNDTVQWLQTLYVLFYGGFLIVGGKLADVKGRKKIFVIGAILFLFTSLGAGLSTSFLMLALFRAVQGLAAALVMPSALSIITNTFTDPTEQSKAIGIFSSFAAIGSGCGLSVGGIITTYLGWQWVFFINVPVISVALILAYFYIPSDTSRSDALPDVFSAMLITVSIILLSFAVHEAAHIKQQWPVLLVAVIFTVLFMLWFVNRNSKSNYAFIDFSLFRHSITLTGNGVTILLGAVFTGYLFVLSLIMQKNMQLTAAHAGLMLFPFSMLSAVVSKFLYPVLVRKFNLFNTAVIGMTLFLVGCITLMVSLFVEYRLLVVLLSTSCVTGSGMAIAFPSLTVMAVRAIPGKHHGLASSVVTTSYFIGAGLGLSGLGLFMSIGDARQYINGLPIAILIVYALAGLILLFRIKGNKTNSAYL